MNLGIRVLFGPLFTYFPLQPLCVMWGTRRRRSVCSWSSDPDFKALDVHRSCVKSATPVLRKTCFVNPQHEKYVSSQRQIYTRLRFFFSFFLFCCVLAVETRSSLMDSCHGQQSKWEQKIKRRLMWGAWFSGKPAFLWRRLERWCKGCCIIISLITTCSSYAIFILPPGGGRACLTEREGGV